MNLGQNTVQLQFINISVIFPASNVADLQVVMQQGLKIV